MTTTDAALLAAALLFVLFVVAQALLPALARRRDTRAASAKVDAAILRAKEGSSKPAIAAAYREAATIALDELRRPRLAIRLLLSAEAVEPDQPATVELVARAMTRARDLRALERYLWTTLDARRGPPAELAALDALLALYEGPTKAPERARVLRRMASRATDVPANR